MKKVRIFNVGSQAVNRYLINSGSHRLLVDAGFPGTVNDLGRAMRKTRFKIPAVDYLIVTHFHVDHAGAAQELKGQGVRFVLFDIQIPFISPMEKFASGKWPYLKLEMEDNLVVKIEESRAFLAKLGLRGQVYTTPGHTDDSITLLLDSGEAFTGDLLPEFLLTDETGHSYHSWETLKKENARVIYPGHGDVYAMGPQGPGRG